MDISTLHQQLYLDFSRTTFDVAIAAAPITFTATVQEIAKVCLLIIAGNVKIQRYILFCKLVKVAEHSKHQLLVFREK
jgi:hypothetical protein